MKERRCYVVYIIGMSYLRMVFLLSFVIGVMFSIEKSHAFQGNFENYESIMIISLEEKKCVPSKLDPLFEGGSIIEGIEVCYEFVSRNEIKRCLVDLETGERECKNLTPLSIAGEVLSDENKTEEVQSFLSELTQSEDIVLTEENEALISEIQDLLSGLRFVSSQQESIVSSLRNSFFSQDDDNFDELKDTIFNKQLILSVADLGGGFIASSVLAGLSHKLSPIPGTQKVVMPDQTRRGLFLRTARGGVKLTRSLFSITGWLRRGSKVILIGAGTSVAIRWWKYGVKEEDAGIAPIVPIAKEGIEFFKNIGLGDNIAPVSDENNELKISSN